MKRRGVGRGGNIQAASNAGATSAAAGVIIRDDCLREGSLAGQLSKDAAPLTVSAAAPAGLIADNRTVAYRKGDNRRGFDRADDENAVVDSTSLSGSALAAAGRAIVQEEGAVDDGGG